MRLRQNENQFGLTVSPDFLPEVNVGVVVIQSFLLDLHLKFLIGVRTEVSGRWCLDGDLCDIVGVKSHVDALLYTRIRHGHGPGSLHLGRGFNGLEVVHLVLGGAAQHSQLIEGNVKILHHQSGINKQKQ